MTNFMTIHSIVVETKEKVLGFIVWTVNVCKHFCDNPSTVVEVEIFQSGPKKWTKQKMLALLKRIIKIKL